ncbi:FAD-dependent oxidoreductase [uncultured Lacinutrix sp.]|uniref:flavin monoamine oxidase family protein n=1 Tax=uncultured Lacinutrix sp. TaxID=574032 RepID=UPI002607401D|nr:FAD-dependent oxidoreductase [uncultured Lacinutrix sp.]
MKKTESKYIIIGAGISGLTTAYQLLKEGEHNFLILEGRDRIGGRVLTKNDIDFGPAWFQPSHKNLLQLLNDLDIEKFNQYSIGKNVLVYNTMAPAHYFESDQSQPSAYRVAGGSIQLIKKMASLLKDKIVLNTKVSKITEIENEIEVLTDNGLFSAEKAIITLPPKLAITLKYTPELPFELNNVMKNTHTWMSNAIKVGMNYESPFWRKKGFSGTIIGQVGPVVELYDHTNADETTYSLMGFVNEGLRDVAAQERKERILVYLEKYLGKQVRHYLSYDEKDWSKDPYTSCSNLKSVYMSPKYGNPVFDMLYMNGKLLFSGTETSPYFGGYIEGAVISGILTANKIKA